MSISAGDQLQIFAVGLSTRETGRVNFLDYEERPWGSFTVLVDDTDHKVKSILVAPGQRLSYQTHARRSEHWFVVRGKGSVVLAGVAHEVGPGSTIDVPQGMAHRIQNAGTEDLIFIEVQHGDYFGEDDIVRLGALVIGSAVPLGHRSSARLDKRVLPRRASGFGIRLKNTGLDLCRTREAGGSKVGDRAQN
jgi:mannose-6-phosphate isomerase